MLRDERDEGGLGSSFSGSSWTSCHDSLVVVDVGVRKVRDGDGDGDWVVGIGAGDGGGVVLITRRILGGVGGDDDDDVVDDEATRNVASEVLERRELKRVLNTNWWRTEA